MSNRYWPGHLPRHLNAPRRTLADNLDVSAQAHPERIAIGFFGQDIAYRELRRQVDALAGWLHANGVAPGDRVVIDMQNSPQSVVAFQAILRANAVAVPLNPMNTATELRHYLDDCGAEVALVMGNVAQRMRQAAQGTRLRLIVQSVFTDYLPQPGPFAVPDWMLERHLLDASCVAWRDALAPKHPPPDRLAGPDDLALICYTSGSTGKPKGCMHTHRSLMHTAAGNARWQGHTERSVFMGAAPMFHVSGLVNGINCPIFVGGTVVPMPRWDKFLAAQLVAHYRVGYLGLPTTAFVDLLTHPEFEQLDFSSVWRISSGGAAMPEGLWARLKAKFGLDFIEAYGLTETAGTTHANPIDRPKRQCLGIPYFDTESIVIDPQTLAECPVGVHGEILLRGPQLFQGYWQQPQATREAFVERDGRRWFRTGDIGYVDDDGYFYVTDRIKRMINAAGYKVWPAEIENALYEHPDIQEACVVGCRDAYRGETVKAFVVLREGAVDVSEASLIEWARQRMAAYKYPRKVEIVATLPRAGTGKVDWQALQAHENARMSS